MNYKEKYPLLFLFISKGLKILIYLFLVISVNCVLQVYQYSAIQRIIDNFTNSFYKALGYLFILFVIWYFDLNQNTFNGILESKIHFFLMENLTPNIIDKLTELDYDTVFSSQTLNYLEKIGKSPEKDIEKSILAWCNFLKGIFSGVGLSIYFYRISSVLSVYYWISILLIFFFNFKYMKLMTDVIVLQCSSERELDYIANLLSQKNSLYELTVFRAITHFTEKYKMLSKKLYTIRLKLTMKGQLWLLLSTLVSCAWISYIIIWGTDMVLVGQITIGVLISLIGISIQISDIADTIARFFNQIISSSIVIKYYNNLLSIKCKPVTDMDINMTNIRSISLIDITYIYPGTQKKVLENFNFKLEVGENVALVGINGSGKSTIVKLICGLIQPTSGKIFFGNIESTKFPRNLYPKIVCAIFQDFGKYPLSLKENIIISNIELAESAAELIEEKLNSTLNLMNMDRTKLNLQLNKIDPNGTDLSEGEWQTVAFARTLFSDASFIIFDEPTASLDPLAESYIYEKFMEITKGKGSLMISHRMASAALAKRICVIDKGKIVEEGSHDFLLQKNGIYSQMYHSQAKWYERRDDLNEIH